MPPESRVFANRYEISGEIGRGGMATVYLARDQLLDRPVAVKVLSAEFAADPANVERFRREARSAARLNHPNIVATYDWGGAHGTYYIVMEYVPGQTLRQLIHTYGHLAPHEAVPLAAQIADALEYAHQNGVVHRDVKPGNVLVTPDGQVKVADFGIARAESTTGLTRTGAVLGTATYFSPEQAQGFPLDGRSDVYALGVVLYEMIAGTPPFDDANPVSVAYKHVREEPMPPSRVYADIPGALDRIVLTAMAKNVEQRYQSAGEMQADLLRFERGRPLVGGPAVSGTPTAIAPAIPASAAAGGRLPPPSVTYGEPRPSSDDRRWAPIAAVGVVFALLIALIVVLIVQSDIGGGGDATPTADVPQVVGQPFDQAEAALKTAGLDSIRQDVDAPDQPAAVVLSQDPEAGRKAPKGSKVTLKVSSATILMPIVVGQTRDAAQAALVKAYLNPTFVEADSDQPPGTVLSSDPAGGSQVPKVGIGRPTVTVTVAREPVVVVVDVAGQDPVAAAATLGQAGFMVTAVDTPSPTVPVGKVIGTDPAAGTPLPKGSPLKLLVSTGPEMVDVPNMIGQTQAMAEALLHTQLGFGIQESFVVGAPAQKGKVITQTPSSGKAAKGSTIVITIGK
jgi:serine/threonine-protein kinase